MRGYETWSFRDRSFLFAFAMSILWHLFWFFSVSIVVSPSKIKGKERPVIVSLGPVIDDSIFRALAETKPQISETFYRHMSDFSQSVNVEVKTAERYVPGSVVSVPFGKRVNSFLRTLMGGEKKEPEDDFASRIGTGLPEDGSALSGEVKERRLLSKPADPSFPAGMETSLEGSTVEIRFVVDPSGAVTEADILSSSGSPDLDLFWLNFIKQWQFAPLEKEKTFLRQSGKIRLRFKPRIAKV